MHFIYWVWIICGILICLTILVDQYIFQKAHAEVIIPDLYGKWDKTPCYSFNFARDQLAYRYTLLRAAIDLRKDIGHYYQIWDVPKKECVNIRTHSSTNQDGDFIIFGNALCNSGNVTKSCTINLWLEGMPLNKAYNTIKHEIFHSFGFGHITTTTPQEFPALVLTNDLMLSSTTPYHKFTKADKYAFDYKYGENGFAAPNNHTLGYTVIPRELLAP